MSRYKMVELGTLIQQAKTVRCGDDCYPVLSMTMHNGLVLQDDKFKKIIASKDRSDYKVVKRNQLVISFPIDEGVLAAQRIVDAGIVSPAYGTWDINQEKILPEFLEYSLRCDRALSYYKAKLRGSTARRRSLPTPTLLAFTVPLPDISEQKHILEVLHKAKSLISKRTEEIELLDNLTKARFIELFGDPVTNEKNWPRLTLGDICEIGSSKRVFEKDYVPNGIPFFRTKEIVELSKGNPISTELFITGEHYAELKKAYGAPQKDDLLISAVGTIGTIWIVNGDFEFYFKDGNLIQIKASPNFNSIFMKFLLNELIANYKKGMSAGTAYSALTIAGLKKMLVYDVPVALQNQFATFVEQTDKSKVVVKKALDEAQILFDSLMQEYFG